MEGIVILFTYVIIMLALTFKDKVTGERQFNTGGGNISPHFGALSVAATWIWAPALFVSAEKAYSWGWQGLAWFLVPNILCLMLFAPFAEKIRRVFPEGVTLSGFMQDRYKSRSVGNVYRFQLGALAVLSTGVQLLAGSKILSVITGIPFFAMTVILCVIAYSYSRKSGIIASVKTDAFQMVLILLICAVAVPWALDIKGGTSLIEGLGGVSEISGWEIAIAFGIPNAIGLISGPFGDQSFWQRAFSIRENSVKKSFVYGALLFGLVPLSMGIIGLVAGGSGFVAADAGFVNFELIRSIFPAWFMVPFLFMVVSGLISTVDSNLCAVSSLASDVKGGLKTARFSMLALLVLGILVANIPGITVTDLFLFYGTLRASTLFVTLLTIFGKRLAAGGVFYGVILSVLVGLPVFAFGSVADIPEMKVAGSVLSVGISGTFAIIYTGRMKKNEDYQSKH